MKRSAALAGLMVLAAASGAVAQSRLPAQQLPHQGGAVTQASCRPGSYSVVQSPDGRSVTVLFDAFSASAPSGRARIVRTSCRITAPMTLPEGYGATLVSVDYRGFTQLASRQAAELVVDYEVGAGNRAPRFQRILTGPQETDFNFTDRPARTSAAAACGRAARGPTVLAINASVAISTGARQPDAMIMLDSADQAGAAGMTFRFEVRPCGRTGLQGDVDTPL